MRQRNICRESVEWRYSIILLTLVCPWYKCIATGIDSNNESNTVTVTENYVGKSNCWISLKIKSSCCVSESFEAVFKKEEVSVCV